MAPQIQNLAKNCGWTIDNKLAESIAKIVQSDPKATKPVNGNAIANSDRPRTGFGNQVFEPSPLDDLSKLQLTTDAPGNNVNTVTYSRPPSTVRIVKAQVGDTIESLPYARKPIRLRSPSIMDFSK